MPSADDILLSFIVPFYKRIEYFKLALPHNAVFSRPNTEVVLVLDEPTQEHEVVDLVKSNPQVRFRVIVNDEDHAWRPPCKALNVGIRNARGHVVAIMSPESIMLYPSPDYFADRLWILMQRYVYATGLVCSVEPGYVSTVPNFATQCYENYFGLPDIGTGYGFLAVKVEHLYNIQGFDESRTKHGGDDDDIRIRLMQSGIHQNCDPCIRIAHISGPTAPRVPRNEYEPYGGRLHQPNFGTSYSRVAHDWKI